MAAEKTTTIAAVYDEAVGRVSKPALHRKTTMTFNREPRGRRSPRLQGYNYSQDGAYFVTICVHQRECLFGEIKADGIMRLNSLGEIAMASWNELPQHYPHVELDAFVVMPNHVHGILVLHEAVVSHKSVAPPHHGLSEIIRGFKTWSARKINETRGIQGVPVWQRNFYDEIVRNEAMLNRIRQYILTNPAQWASDKENLPHQKP